MLIPQPWNCVRTHSAALRAHPVRTPARGEVTAAAAAAAVLPSYCVRTSIAALQHHDEMTYVLIYI